MKSRISLLALMLVSVVAFNSCKKTTEEPKTPEQEQTEKLARTWKVATGANAVTIAGNDVSADWATFEITFTDGGYTCTGQAADKGIQVWPNTGTWTYATDDISTLLRSDGTDITISVTDAALLMTFNYSSAGGRLDGVWHCARWWRRTPARACAAAPG